MASAEGGILRVVLSPLCFCHPEQRWPAPALVLKKLTAAAARDALSILLQCETGALALPLLAALYAATVVFLGFERRSAQALVSDVVPR
jgi:hypothetical protein